MNGVEHALSALWDKAREASLLISTLREERKRLAQRVAELEEEVSHLRVSNQQAQADLQKAAETSAGAGPAIDLEEKRVLQQRLRTMITKLDQYIGQ
ncbi:MAG: cell division protein ZapB [Bacteroidetes bacterium]|nr:cell division protein ZapB [Bacteroidota bacterium]